MTLNLPLLYVLWLEEYCQTSPNKNKSPNLWHVTRILVCCIFGSARVLHALKIGRTKNLTILLLVPVFCFTHKSAHFRHHFISGVNCFTTVDCNKNVFSWVTRLKRLLVSKAAQFWILPDNCIIAFLRTDLTDWHDCLTTARQQTNDYNRCCLKMIPQRRETSWTDIIACDWLK